MHVLYQELRQLARARVFRMAPGQTLQPTEVVHEAYLRLMNNDGQQWNSRGHFFGAAARAMRNVLVEHARQKNSLKRGGDKVRVEINVTLPGHEQPVSAEELLSLHTALERMQSDYPQHVEIVLLLYFGGLTVKQAADALNISESTVERRWRFARAWLKRDIASH